MRGFLVLGRLLEMLRTLFSISSKRKPRPIKTNEPNPIKNHNFTLHLSVFAASVPKFAFWLLSLFYSITCNSVSQFSLFSIGWIHFELWFSWVFNESSKLGFWVLLKPNDPINSKHQKIILSCTNSSFFSIFFTIPQMGIL